MSNAISWQNIDSVILELNDVDTFNDRGINAIPSQKAH